jgi:hypothetical protein
MAKEFDDNDRPRKKRPRDEDDVDDRYDDDVDDRPARRRRRRDDDLEPHRGTLILVLGALSLVVCVICGIVAWIMANEDLKKMKAGVMDPEGESNTKIGKILGIVSVALNVLIFSIWLVVFIIAMGAAGAAGR